MTRTTKRRGSRWGFLGVRWGRVGAFLLGCAFYCLARDQRVPGRLFPPTLALLLFHSGPAETGEAHFPPTFRVISSAPDTGWALRPSSYVRT